MTRAVVFAYHNVGVRCLSVLLAGQVEVPLVVTHDDSSDENIWFESVAALAEEHSIPFVTPEDPNRPDLIERIRKLAPEFIFSFYYRRMLGAELLACASRGALNMHGSLLPKYRGRAPVNWAVLKGETQTGASLHYMEIKPDAGALVDQQAVPILPDDIALDVFNKVTWAAELVLHRSLPLLIEGRAPGQPLNLKEGSYYGGRRPEDGVIDWRESAETVHNLIRSVAPPYPGAFCLLDSLPMRILRSHLDGEPARHPPRAPCFYWETGRCYADCRDGRRLHIGQFELEDQRITPEAFHARYGEQIKDLGQQK
ncbi:formyltransferase [uncultured Nitrospira sp.]|uniref:formyltransferase n=1 Tax=uncultured Nitrospira sp. TaxID=157176 RepID=UPI003140AF21